MIFLKLFNPGVAFGFPDPKGSGGTTTTAAVARKVYGEPVLRQRLVELCPPMYQMAMDRILFNDMLLLRLMSCDHYLPHDKIGQFKTVKNILLIVFLFQKTSVENRCCFWLLI